MSTPPSETFSTPVTRLLGITHPILLAGMNAVAGPDLAAAVSNAGGFGVIGGVTYTPPMLRKALEELSAKTKKFGVDLLLPAVGGSARKTNVDYTGGKLPELIDLIIEFKASLFVCAVGVPPKWAVDKLHAAGIPVMNMIGSVRHVKKCLEAGVDIICAQGSEGGGHTGSVATSVLIPQVVDLCRKAPKSTFTNEPVHVIAAGGIFDGRGLAMALALGAEAVWVGTRFICATEASAPKRHQEAVIKATDEDTIRSTIYTGRPMRILNVPYVSDFEEFHRDKIREAQKTGVIAGIKDMEESAAKGNIPPMEARRPLLMGQAVGPITEVLPAKVIIERMVSEAVAIVKGNAKCVSKL